MKRDKIIHPDGNDATRWDGPSLRAVVIWRYQTVIGHSTEEPCHPVKQDVRKDAGDDTVCDAARSKVSYFLSRMIQIG
jgi:hypothetical protein